MSEERIAQLVVEYLLIAAGGMVDDRKEEKASAGDDSGGKRSAGGSGGKGGNIPILGDIFKQFETKLFALLAPAALMATILTSATSGLSTFIAAVKMIGNTLGVLLFPAIALAASVLMTLNDAVLSTLLPNLEEWATAIITGGIQTIDFLAETAVGAANELIRFGRSVAESESFLYKFIGGLAHLTGSTMVAIANAIESSLGGLKGFAGSGVAQLRRMGTNIEMGGSALFNRGNQIENEMPAVRQYDSIMRKMGLENGVDIGGAEGFGKGVRDNLKKFMAEFVFQNMPKSQQMSIGQANLNAQMATFNMSPFERDQLKLMRELIDAMYRAIDKLQPPTTG